MLSENVTKYTNIIKKYTTSGPRYTSYPPANHFTASFGLNDYMQTATHSNTRDNIYGQLKPLSLYIHIPFCDTICYYCGCSKVVTKDRSKAAPYLERLEKEIVLQGKLFDAARPVDQLHFGGGTPTFISMDQLQHLMKILTENFRLHDDDSGEYSIELDPRDIEVDELQVLREMGFNRLSFGIQDFNEDVQKAVNRQQSTDKIFSLIRRAREVGFKSISTDLIYGLPKQTVETFRETIDQIILVNPDRISIFNYAHLPAMFKPQRRIDEKDLHLPVEKIKILGNFIDQLQEAGYIYIGMDHFAKPDDELAVAQNEGRLSRNFQGYSTHADCDLVGLGLTSIGKVNNCYAQNEKDIEKYYERIDNDQIPIAKGLKLGVADLIRSHVIVELMSQYFIDIHRVEEKFGIDFNKYFESEYEQLTEMEKDGLLSINSTTIRVGETGKWFIRNICMVFDTYLARGPKVEYSKVV